MPEFLSSIEARTALETPQIVTSWVFNPNLRVPFSAGGSDGLGIPWVWDNLYLRKSLYNFPQAATDGDAVFTEAYSSSPSTSCADTALQAMKNYNYSLLFRYTEPPSSLIIDEQDINRLGVQIDSVFPADGFVGDITKPGAGYFLDLVVGSPTGSVTGGFPTVTIAGFDLFANNIQAGSIFRINSGVNVGYYRVLSVNSATQLTLTSNVGTSDGSILFSIFTHHKKFWIAGLDFHKKPALWRWDATTKLVDRKIGLSDLLDLDETVVSIAYVQKLSGVYYICLVTQKRYLRFTYDPLVVGVDDTTGIIIDRQWTFGALTPGFQVTGGFVDPASFGVSVTVWLLDSESNKIIVLLESNGSLVATYDLSLPDANIGLIGMFPVYGYQRIMVGNGNVVLDLDVSGSSPIGISAVLNASPLKRNIGACSCLIYRTPGVLTTYDHVLADESEGKLTEYQRDSAFFYLWQPFVCDKDTIARYHLDETSGNPQDSSLHSNHGVNTGMTPAATGKFYHGFHATGLGQYISIASISTLFNPAQGAVSFWFAADNATLWSTTSTLFLAKVDGNNYVKVYCDAGSIKFRIVRGGTSNEVSIAHPSADTSFHCYTLTWSSNMAAYVDGVLAGSTGLSGTWVGTVSVATIGDDPATSATAIGVYDEVIVSMSASAAMPTRQQAYTLPNEAWAHSGRSYTSTYDDDDPLGFHYRDELFTEKFLGGEYLSRNDFDRAQLHPPNQVVEDGEVIFRGPTPLPVLGDLGRLSRLVGLFLDRIADSRTALLNFFDTYVVDVESVPLLADQLGVYGLDKDWNLDKKRRYARLMSPIMKRGGTARSYPDLARLLGFMTVGDHLTARRRWDSVYFNAVFDSRVQAIPLDTMGSMDTFDPSFPLALLRWRFYTPSTKATANVSSVTQLLTDVSASFRTTAQVGDLIVVFAQAGYNSTTFHIVDQVRSDTVLHVTPNFSSVASGVTYKNYWEVPMPDPLSVFLLERFRDIAPDSMKVMHRDEML